jgi:hypothetical protein
MATKTRNPRLTKAEQAKYQEYLNLIAQHNESCLEANRLEPCSKADWVTNYRGIQKTKKGTTTNVPD